MEGKVSAKEANAKLAEFKRIGKEKTRILEEAMKNWENKKGQ
jgi:hypothetical protein